MKLSLALLALAALSAEAQRAPVAAPGTIQPSDGGTFVPTVTRAPFTAAPFTAAPVTANPTAAPFVAETLPTTRAPVINNVVPAFPTAVEVSGSPVSTFVSDTPSDSPSFFSTVAAASDVCQDNADCNALNLTGLCCPTLDNWTLACCGGPAIPYYQRCELNPKCNALGLTEACCPTSDGRFLDCCAALPDKCQEPGACPIFSAAQFKLELSSGAAAPAAKQFTAVAVALAAATAAALVAAL